MAVLQKKTALKGAKVLELHRFGKIMPIQLLMGSCRGLVAVRDILCSSPGAAWAAQNLGIRGDLPGREGLRPRIHVVQARYGDCRS